MFAVQHLPCCAPCRCTLWVGNGNSALAACASFGGTSSRHSSIALNFVHMPPDAGAVHQGVWSMRYGRVLGPGYALTDDVAPGSIIPSPRVDRLLFRLSESFKP